MKDGTETAIFKHIRKEEHSEEEKLIAIKKVLDMPTHNGITKDEILEAFRWILEGLDNMKRAGGTRSIHNSDVKYDVYDNSFDIVLYCENEEEQKKAKEMIKNARAWIPVTERLPDDDRYIMLSFANFSMPEIGRYEGGVFYEGDCEEPCSKYGFRVNAWMELPEKYRGDKYGEIDGMDQKTAGNKKCESRASQVRSAESYE